MKRFLSIITLLAIVITANILPVNATTEISIYEGDYITLEGELRSVSHEYNGHSTTLYMLYLDEDLYCDTYGRNSSDDSYYYNNTITVDHVQINGLDEPDYYDGEHVKVAGQVMLANTIHHLTDFVLIDSYLISEADYKTRYIEALLDEEYYWLQGAEYNAGAPSLMQFVDLDFDGTLEFVMQSGGGTMRNCDADVYYFDGEDILQADGNDTLAKSGFQNNITGYYNSKSNKYVWLGNSTLRADYANAWTGNFEFNYSNNSFTSKYYSARIMEDKSYTGNPTYTYFGSVDSYGASGVEITESEYNKINSDKLENLVSINVNTLPIYYLDWKDYDYDEKFEALEESYDAFNYNHLKQDNPTKIEFLENEEVSGYLNSTVTATILLDSVKYNINDLDIESSNTKIADILLISKDEGNYATSGNEKIAAIHLTLRAKGSAIITATAPDGTRATLNINVNMSSFLNEYDGWGFANSPGAFNYEDNYRIREEVYESVFGKSYVATAKANNKVFESMMPVCGGNCYGMSVTSVLFYNNMLNWNDFLSKNKLSYVDYPNEYYDSINNDGYEYYTTINKNSVLTKLIEQYQVFQMSTSKGHWFNSDSTYSLLENNYYKKISNNSFEHLSTGQYISKLYKMATNSSSPLIVYMTGNAGTHAIVLKDNQQPKELGNGWYGLSVYDPNHPYFNKALQTSGLTAASYYCNYNEELLELNPSENKWRYHGSLNSSNPSDYWGCDNQGNILTLSRNNKSIPDLLMFLNINNSTYPTSFSGTEEWTVESKTKTVILVSPSSSFDVLTMEGERICSIKSGAIADSSTSVDYYQFVGNSFTTSGGRITIPYKEFKIINSEGDYTVVDNNSAISVQYNGLVAINMDENKLTASGENDDKIVSQITEIIDNEHYTSVVAEGNLKAEDTISIELQNSKANVENRFADDSHINICTDNELNTVEKTIAEIEKDSHNTVIIDDVRNEYSKKESTNPATESLEQPTANNSNSSSELPTDEISTSSNENTNTTSPKVPFEPVVEPTEPATKATSPLVTPKLKKRNNPIKVTVKTKSVKKKKLKSKKQTVKPLSITKAQGKYTVSLVKSGTTKKIRSKILVNKKGVITFKKGKYKKGTYKVKLKIYVKGNLNYKSKTVTKAVKIKIK